MQTLKNTQSTVEQPGVQINDALKDQFGSAPLFPEKIEKATRIMTLVRKKQQNKK